MDTSEVMVPSIFNLHHDILLHIFHLNTYESETEYCIHNPDPTPTCALNVARHSSHVCRMWRQTILDSPAIWGRIIDMTIINASSETWSEEVLKRTGTYPLSIYGRVGYTPRSRAFLASLLAANWHRVRGLDVVMHDPDGFDTAMWEIIFHHPAPYLESFLIVGSVDRVLLLRGGKKFGPVIGGPAPSLRRFHCTAIELNPRAKWIPQLLSLTLSHPLTPTDMLTLLSTTTRLESLFIKGISSERRGCVQWGTTIHLPHLRRLHVRGKATPSLVVLRNIVSHPDCALSVQAKNYNGDNISPDKIDELARIFTPYAGRYFDLHRPPRLLIVLGHLAFDLQSSIATDMVYFVHPELRISFEITRGVHSPTISSLNSILPTLASIPLGCVTELELINGVSSWDLPTDPGFLKFLEALPSVQTLIITQYTLEILGNPHLDTSLVLPLLETVRIRPSSPFTSSFEPRLVLFLSRRSAVRLSVFTLDLSEVVDVRYRFDWRFLDVFVGLRVVWRRDSEEVGYICGSGEKTRLNWS